VTKEDILNTINKQIDIIEKSKIYDKRIVSNLRRLALRKIQLRSGLIEMPKKYIYLLFGRKINPNIGGIPVLEGKEIKVYYIMEEINYENSRDKSRYWR